MRKITKLSELIEIGNNQKAYIRWSNSIAKDIKRGYSLDHSNYSRHAGLSAQNVRSDDPELLARMVPEYRYTGAAHCWIISGRRNGTDSDNAPTVDAESIVVIGEVAKSLIDKCIEYTEAYDNRHYNLNSLCRERGLTYSDMDNLIDELENKQKAAWEKLVSEE